VCVWVCEREWERVRESEREWERVRENEREWERVSENEREWERDRQRERETENERERKKLKTAPERIPYYFLSPVSSWRNWNHSSERWWPAKNTRVTLAALDEASETRNCILGQKNDAQHEIVLPENKTQKRRENWEKMDLRQQKSLILSK